jgi:hypothetical protein
VAVPSPDRPPTMAVTPDASSIQSGEFRGPASRAYRRLRRIFPS